MRRQGKFFWLIFCLIALGVCGCASPVPRHKNDKSCVVEYVTESQKLERIIFAGGKLRSSAELLENNVLTGICPGTQGIIYGRRAINGVEWAKVTTREGLTGWYCQRPEKRQGKVVSQPLDITKKTYLVTYPVIFAGNPDATERINAEIKKYLAVFGYVVGAVGNNLRCRVTNNDSGVVSVLFESPSVIGRFFAENQIQNEKLWTDITRFCYVSPLLTDEASGNRYAAMIELQYALTFEVSTGRRLNVYDFLKGGVNYDIRRKLARFPIGSTVQKDNCFLLPNGDLLILAEVAGKSFGRIPITIKKTELKPLSEVVSH